MSNTSNVQGDRKARLAANLRANLKRRKVQAKGKAADEVDLRSESDTLSATAPDLETPESPDA